MRQFVPFFAVNPDKHVWIQNYEKLIVEYCSLSLDCNTCQNNVMKWPPLVNKYKNGFTYAEIQTENL